MSNNTLKKSEEKPTNLNYYWLITFFLFFITDLSKSYFNCIKIIKPICFFWKNLMIVSFTPILGWLIPVPQKNPLYLQ